MKYHLLLIPFFLFIHLPFIRLYRHPFHTFHLCFCEHIYSASSTAQTSPAHPSIHCEEQEDEIRCEKVQRGEEKMRKKIILFCKFNFMCEFILLKGIHKLDYLSLCYSYINSFYVSQSLMK